MKEFKPKFSLFVVYQFIKTILIDALIKTSGSMIHTWADTANGSQDARCLNKSNN